MHKTNWTAACGPLSAALKPLFWCNS